jgi:ParB-like chromosome segregation protein Spo0J
MSTDKLHNPFNPDGGEFAKNIRSITGLDDTELKESLKRFGWVEHLPALTDENDVVLVGHRRIRLAKQLGIEPVIKTIRLGKGDEADAKRLAIAIASNLGHAPLTHDDRKRIAEYLYGKREWTMQRIADALNVGIGTVSRDLGNSSTVEKLKPAKTASNPKGAGRPKGTTKPHSESEKLAKARDLIRPRVEADQPLKTGELNREHGISRHTFERAAQLERVRLAALAEPEIDRTTLSLTAQEKLDAAIRQHTRKLDIEFETRVLDECKRRLNEISLPHYYKQLQELERSISNRKGIMDRVTYRKILACLHPDRVADEVLKKRYEEAFRLFTELEKRVLDEKESPTEFRKMPRTYEELMAARANKQAAERAKRATRKGGLTER